VGGERMKRHVTGCSCVGSGELGSEMCAVLGGFCLTGIFMLQALTY
jgi:hypothetical protein